MTYKEAWKKAEAAHNEDHYGGDWIETVYELMEQAEQAEETNRYKKLIEEMLASYNDDSNEWNSTDWIDSLTLQKEELDEKANNNLGS